MALMGGVCCVRAVVVALDVDRIGSLVSLVLGIVRHGMLCNGSLVEDG